MNSTLQTGTSAGCKNEILRINIVSHQRNTKKPAWMTTNSELTPLSCLYRYDNKDRLLTGDSLPYWSAYIIPRNVYNMSHYSGNGVLKYI